jgi:hypothetical protein
MLDPDIMLGTLTLAAALASMRSAPRRNSSAIAGRRDPARAGIGAAENRRRLDALTDVNKMTRQQLMLMETSRIPDDAQFVLNATLNAFE